MSEEIKETQEAVEAKEMKFSRSPVSDIIDDVWRAPAEPPTLRREKGKKTVKPKSGPAILDLPPPAEGEPRTEGEEGEASPSQPGATLALNGHQLIAIFDGLKLLLAKLSASDPQPLQAIYVTTGLIQGLEPVVMAQLRALMEARA